MKKSERFALDQWLSDYPDGMTYAEIIEALTAEEGLWQVDDVTPWELVETFPLDAVAGFIDDTRAVLERCFPESLREEGAA
jgi:hypothetical protein